MQGSGIAHSRLGGGASLGGALVTNASLATLGLGTLRSRRGKGCRGQHRGQVCFLPTRYGKPRRRGNRDASARAADGATETRSKRNKHHPNEMISASPRGSDARDASIAALIARPPRAKIVAGYVFVASNTHALGAGGVGHDDGLRALRLDGDAGLDLHAGEGGGGGHDSSHFVGVWWRKRRFYGGCKYGPRSAFHPIHTRETPLTRDHLRLKKIVGPMPVPDWLGETGPNHKIRQQFLASGRFEVGCEITLRNQPRLAFFDSFAV